MSTLIIILGVITGILTCRLVWPIIVGIWKVCSSDAEKARWEIQWEHQTSAAERFVFYYIIRYGAFIGAAIACWAKILGIE